MMPHKDGYLVARKIRQQSDVMPIIFLSTKAHITDRLKGYETGADDYLVKPFSMKELLMKIDVFLRRTKKMQPSAPVEFQLRKMRFSYTEQKVYKPDETLNITQKEAELLRFFCEHPNRVIKREEVLINVWGKDDFFLGRSMDVYITKLRKILRGDSDVLLETIHGVGYRFSVLNEE
jgi:DNA-binding response OmpR family regulator